MGDSQLLTAGEVAQKTYHAPNTGVMPLGLTQIPTLKRSEAERVVRIEGIHTSFYISQHLLRDSHTHILKTVSRGNHSGNYGMILSSPSHSQFNRWLASAT